MRSLMDRPYSSMFSQYRRSFPVGCKRGSLYNYSTLICCFVALIVSDGMIAPTFPSAGNQDVELLSLLKRGVMPCSGIICNIHDNVCASSTTMAIVR